MYKLTDLQEEHLKMYIGTISEIQLDNLLMLVLNDYIIDKIKNNTFNINDLGITDDCEKLVIKKLVNIIESEIDDDKSVFGVNKCFFIDANWYYKDPIKKLFYSVKPIFAKTLNDLEQKVKNKGGQWQVLNHYKFENLRKNEQQHLKNKILPTSEFIKDLIRQNSKGSHYKKIKADEGIKQKKREDLEKELKLNELNQRYSGDRHEYFR